MESDSCRYWWRDEEGGVGRRRCGPAGPGDDSVGARGSGATGRRGVNARERDHSAKRSRWQRQGSERVRQRKQTQAHRSAAASRSPVVLLSKISAAHAQKGRCARAPPHSLSLWPYSSLVTRSAAAVAASSLSAMAAYIPLYRPLHPSQWCMGRERERVDKANLNGTARRRRQSWSRTASVSARLLTPVAVGRPVQSWPITHST